MSAHYGGNKAPIVRSGLNIMTAAVSNQGAQVWWSADDGVTWQVEGLNAANADHVVALSENLVVSWGIHAVPQLHQNPSATPGGWSSASQAWPLASWNILDVDVSASGEVWILATVPDVGNLVEGALYVIRGTVAGWSSPVQLSAGSVGDAALVRHSSGLWTALWSQRSGNTWNVSLANSSDGSAWSTRLNIVTGIVAPSAQEAAVQVAADALANEGLALAFTGWAYAPHSQLWSKAVDVNTGAVLVSAQQLPDTGDMVYQPSLVVTGVNAWAVVWQQKMEIDQEILFAQHRADGSWSAAVNVSADPLHVNRDPHVALGASHDVMVAFTSRIIPDVQESYTISEGNLNDSALDGDGDGIPDSQEMGLDMNSDGIDDGYSAVSASWLGQGGRYAMQVTGGNFAGIQAMWFDDMALVAPIAHVVLGNMFSFRVMNVAVGGSVQVHISVPTPLPANTQWLKWNNGSGWSEGAGTQLDADLMGITLTLVDGGMGDEDGLANGQILDPAVFASPQVAGGGSAVSSAGSASSGGGGGCVIGVKNQFDPTLLALVLLALLGGMRRRVMLKN